MSTTNHEWYERNGEQALFQVGFHDLEPGVDYVLNNHTGQLDRIYATEHYFSEGIAYTRVETRPGEWHDIDGTTTLAKRHDTINDLLQEVPASTNGHDRHHGRNGIAAHAGQA